MAGLPLWQVLALFAGAAIVILVCGLRLTTLADRVADRLGLGEAVVGGVLLGAATSLSGTVVSLTAALEGRASLAFSNGVGGIAAQTAFLALADLVYRRANLEHAAAEAANLVQGALLLLLLTLPLLAWSAPEVAFWSVHPVSAVLVAVYLLGVAMAAKTRQRPMWRPVETRETRVDRPESEAEAAASAKAPLLAFGGLMLVMAAAGWVVADSGGALIDALGVSASLVGALVTAVATSLPELVTTLAAVRRGALQLAVGGIIGGNSFDVLFLTLSDLGYREGSIYHAIGAEDIFWLAVGLSVNACLLLGLIYRQERGPAAIGFESLGILLIYFGAIAVQASV